MITIRTTTTTRRERKYKRNLPLCLLSTLVLATTTTTTTATATATAASSFGIAGSSIRRKQQQQQNQQQQGTGTGLRWLKEESLPSHNNIQHQQQQQQQQQSKSFQHTIRNTRQLQLNGRPKNAMEACQRAKAEEEEDIILGESGIGVGSSGSVCTCEAILLDERYSAFLNLQDQPTAVKLSCLDTRCDYCSLDGTVCDRFTYGAIFEELPRTATTARSIVQVGYFETNQYIQGRPEAVVYTEYHDPTLTNNIHSCSMDIDGLRCAVCEYMDCIDDTTPNNNNNNNKKDPITKTYYGLRIVCSNISIGDGQGGVTPALDFETCDPQQLDSLGQTQGVFELYNDDYGQCYTATEACDRDALELDTDGSYYTCQCQGDEKEEFPELEGVKNSPFLLDVKLRCNKKSNVGVYGATCNGATTESGVKSDSLLRTYSSYATESERRTVTTADNKVVVVHKFDCVTTVGSEGCKSCIASIDGKECNQCTMVECSGGIAETTNDKQPQIQCSNVQFSNSQNGIIDLCYDAYETSVETPFEYFGQGSGCGGVPLPTRPSDLDDIKPENIPNKKPVIIENPDDPQPPKEIPIIPALVPAGPVSQLACEKKLRELGSRQNYVDGALMVCECLDLGDGSSTNNADVDEGTLLSCTTNNGGCGTLNGGSICNTIYGDDGNSNGVCFREELVQGFLADGNKTPLTRTTTYTHGTALGNSMIGRTLSLTDYDNDKGSCQLVVDGVTCQSCQLQNCGGGQVNNQLGVRPLVDCTNMIDQRTFALGSCDAFTKYKEGFLLRLAVGSSQENDYTNFSICSNEFKPPPETTTTPEQDDGADGSTSTTAEAFSVIALDPSLPTTCSKAQPIVLPTQQDLEASSGAEMARNSNEAAFVSLISSTIGIPSSTSNMDACTGGTEGKASGNDSPSLWYQLNGTGKGVHASVCRAPTDFQARISIYTSSTDGSSGGCDDDNNNLRCVAGTQGDAGKSSCDVHWIAQEGSSYYLRIHGSTPEQTGNFNLFLQTIPEEHLGTCSSSSSDDTDENDESLNQACLKCAKERSIMVEDATSKGKDINCQCIDNTGTGGYHLTCVEVSCLKCNPSHSVCGFSTSELDITAGGKVRKPSYESFYTMNNQDSTVSVTEVQQTETCIEIKDPYQTCMTSREELMSVSSSDEGEEGEENKDKTFCECRGTSEEGNFILLCSVYDAYQYCSSAGSNNCATVLFGQNISQYGSVTGEFRNFEFVTTADATTTDEESKKEENASIAVERTEFGCSVLMNGQQCQKCELTQCENEISEDTLVGENVAAGLFNDISVDCSNVLIEGNEDTENDDVATTFECGSVGGGGGAAAAEGTGGNYNGGMLSILAGELTSKSIKGSDSSSDGVTDEILDKGGSSDNDNDNDSNDNNIFNSDPTATTDDLPKPQQTIPPEAFPPTVPPVTQPTSPPNESPPPPTIPPIFLTEDTIPSNDSVSPITNTTTTNTTKDNDSVVGIVDGEDTNNNNDTTIGDNTTAEQNTTSEEQESSGASRGGCFSVTGVWSQVFGVHIIIGIISASLYFVLP